MDFVLLAGAVAYWTTVLVYKSGPGDIFDKFRSLVEKWWGSKNHPLTCVICASPYILVAILFSSLIWPPFVQFFGILGIAAALRGQSQEFQ